MACEKMNNQARKSRCGFVVIKFRVNDECYYLMREDPRWKDVNFIGGHECSRDGGSLERTARRELLEEVPSVRLVSDVELVPLTDEVVYGPVYSRSAESQVEYILDFFRLKFVNDPRPMLEAAGPRTHNKLIRERALLVQGTYRVSKLVGFLGDILRGGLELIPCSWPDDIVTSLHHSSLLRVNQLELWP